MRRLLFSSLAGTVVFVVLLSVLPALVIILGSGMDHYNASRTIAEERGVRYVRLVAQRQRLFLENTRTLFQVLEQLKEIQRNDDRAGSLLLRMMLRNYPMYTDIFFAGPDGSVRMSALPRTGGVEKLSPELIAAVEESGRLGAVHIISRERDGGAQLHVFLPLSVPGAGFRGVLGAVVAPSFYETMLAGLDLPPGSTIRLMGADGAILGEYPPTSLPELSESTRRAMIHTARTTRGGTGYFSARAGDGVMRFTAFKELRLQEESEPYVYAFFTLPESYIYREPGLVLLRDLALLAGALFFTLAAAWGLSHMGVVRPVRNLLDVATRLGNGDFAARAKTGANRSEIDFLAREFNVMAEALEQRDKELVGAREAAEQSRKAKSEFLANMSHEIRTPMNAILGMAYLTLKTEMTPQQKNYVTKLLAAANTLLRVINDILDFSKIEAGRFTMERISFSLVRLLGTVRGEAAAKAGEKGLQLHLRLAPEVPPQLMGDPLRLGQALSTLIRESLARSERGEVSVLCDLEREADEEVTLRFTVRDAGVGLTPMQLRNLRAVFSGEGGAAEGGLDGSSLSLMVCGQLFRLMRGGVSVESDFGYGTRYMATGVFEKAPFLPAQQTVLFTNQRALVVGDDESLRLSLAEMLTGFGLKVENLPEREDIASVLREAETAGRPYVFLFADWRPVSQETLLRFGGIRKRSGLLHPPFVVLLTAQGRTDTPDDLGKHGINALLYKPVNGSVLFDTLGNLLAARDPAEAPLVPSSLPSRAEDLAGLRVLLVEDNTVNQQIAEEILKDAGVRLRISGNGLEAVALLRKPEERAAVDLVLMDLQMPEMDGLEATKIIRSLPSCSRLQLPIIAMTAHSDSREVAACFAVGMNDHMTKPIAVDKLFSVIRRWAPLRLVKAAEFARLLDAVDALARRLPLSADEAEESVRALAPFIHEGRVRLLRKALTGNEAADVRTMLEELRNPTA